MPIESSEQHDWNDCVMMFGGDDQHGTLLTDGVSAIGRRDASGSSLAMRSLPVGSYLRSYKAGSLSLVWHALIGMAKL